MSTGVQITEVRVSVVIHSDERRADEDVIGLDGWVLDAGAAPAGYLQRPVGDAGVTVAVANGVADAPAGRRAARIAAQQLTCRLDDDAYPAGGDADLVRSRFSRASATIRDAADDRARCTGCAAAAVLVRSDGRTVVANVGNVHVYRLVDGYMGRLTPGGGRRPEGAAVDRWLGGDGPPERSRPYVCELSVLPNDCLVICAGGLVDTLDETLLPRLTGGPGLGAATDSGGEAGRAVSDGDAVMGIVLNVMGRHIRRPESPAAKQPALWRPT